MSQAFFSPPDVGPNDNMHGAALPLRPPRSHGVKCEGCDAELVCDWGSDLKAAAESSGWSVTGAGTPESPARYWCWNCQKENP